MTKTAAGFRLKSGGGNKGWAYGDVDLVTGDQSQLRPLMNFTDITQCADKRRKCVWGLEKGL